MKRPIAFLAVSLLAGTCLTGSANAGWFSSDEKPAQPNAQAASQAQAPGNLDNDVRQAQLLRVAGDLDGATKMLAQMMMVYPDDPRVVGEYGKVLVQQGRSQDAVNFLKRAAELQPNDWMVYSAMGVAYDQLGDLPSARAAYDRALQIKPGDPAVLNNYGLSRMLAGDLDGAQRMLAQAQTAPNADPKISRNVAMLAALKTSGAQTMVATNRTPKPLPDNVVMQRVPNDPKAGPVVVAKTDRSPATRAPRPLVADAARNKPVPPKKKDATPSLRMTADAAAD